MSAGRSDDPMAAPPSAEPTPHQGEREPPGPSERREGAWSRLAWWEYAVTAIPVLVVGWFAVFYLPRGVCFGDHGDLQLASITLGIMHPPGYAGFTTLGFLLSLIPIANKPFLITLGCLGSGLIVLWTGALMQRRLGVHVAVAAAVMLLLAAHKRFWWNIIAPEVYMPALAFLITSVYFLIKYERVHRRRDLIIGALLFGVSLANRPSVILATPFFLFAYMLASRRMNDSWRRRLTGLTLAIVCAAIPLAYSFVYLLVRDQPDIAYNYIERHNLSHGVLPDVSEGFAARIRRAVWLMSAEQFEDGFGFTWSGLQRKLRWVCHDLMYGRPVSLLLLLLVTMTGCIKVFQRSAASAVMLAGVALHSLFFVSIYRVYGQAADLAPFVCAAAVFLGSGVSIATPRTLTPRRTVALTLVLILSVTSVWRTADTPRRWKVARDVDASSFLSELDLPSLPQNSLILSGWAHAVPLWYALYAHSDRPDIDVFSGDPGWLAPKAALSCTRPVFFVDRATIPDQFPAEPFRNIWHVPCQQQERSPHSASPRAASDTDIFDPQPLQELRP